MVTLSWLTASVLTLVLAEGPRPGTAAASFHSCSGVENEAQPASCPEETAACALDACPIFCCEELRAVLCSHFGCCPLFGRGCCRESREQACQPCQDHLSALVGESLNLWQIFWENGCYGEAEQVARQAVTLDHGNLAAQHALAVAEIVNAMRHCQGTAGSGRAGRVCSAGVPCPAGLQPAGHCVSSSSAVACCDSEDCSQACPDAGSSSSKRHARATCHGQERSCCAKIASCVTGCCAKLARASCGSGCCASKGCCAQSAQASCACGQKCRCCQKTSAPRTTRSKKEGTVVIIINCQPQGPDHPSISLSPQQKQALERCGFWPGPASGPTGVVVPLPPPPVLPPPLSGVGPYQQMVPIYIPADHWQYPQPPYRE